MDLRNLAGSVGNLGQSGGNSAIVSSILGMIENHPGGISGLVQSFEQHGLGGVVSSWISPGPNQPVSAQQVQQAVGHDQIQEVAGKLGVDSGTASNLVAQFLPAIVDHLTPNGQLPASGTSIMSMGEGILSSLFHKNI